MATQLDPDQIKPGSVNQLLQTIGGVVTWQDPGVGGGVATVLQICLEIDNGVDVIPTGVVKADLPIYITGIITSYTLLCDPAGDIVIDVWKDVYASYPPTDADAMPGAGKEPTIAATGAQSTDSDLSDWSDQTLALGDILRFNVDSATTCTWAKLVLKVSLS